MKVVGILGSPRANGHTNRLLQEVLSGAATSGADVEQVRLADCRIHGCMGCDACASGECVFGDDMVRIEQLFSTAELIVFGTPVFFWGVSGLGKQMIDRFQTYFNRYYSHGKKPPLPRATGAFVVTAGQRQLWNPTHPVAVCLSGWMRVARLEVAGGYCRAETDNEPAGDVVNLQGQSVNPQEVGQWLVQQELMRQARQAQ